jgi:hypothetical protein
MRVGMFGGVRRCIEEAVFSRKEENHLGALGYCIG